MKLRGIVPKRKVVKMYYYENEIFINFHKFSYSKFRYFQSIGGNLVKNREH